jgi:hypothetical protein
MSATYMSEVVGAMKSCQPCPSIRCTQKVTFCRNIGRLFVRQTRVIAADMCKTCVTKNYWQFMGKNLLLGPWGTISLLVTPIYLVTNTWSYLSARYKMRGAIE